MGKFPSTNEQRKEAAQHKNLQTLSRASVEPVEEGPARGQQPQAEKHRLLPRRKQGRGQQGGDGSITEKAHPTAGTSAPWLEPQQAQEQHQTLSGRKAKPQPPGN
jgi:hypothetical protein